MARRSRASKGRGPTRRERREAAAGEQVARLHGPSPRSGRPPSGRRSASKAASASQLSPRRSDGPRPPKPLSRRWWRVRDRHRLVGGVVVALVGVCSLVLGVGWWLAARPPSWWIELDTDSPQVVATSRAVENWAVSTMTRSRPSREHWAVTITEEDANAWLAVRLPMWVASERGAWPEGIRSVRVRFTEGRIVIGVDIREAGAETPRVVGAAISLRVDPDGAASADIDWTQINRLKLPGSVGVSSLSDWIESAADDDPVAARLAGLVRGDMSSESLGWKLDDGRRVTVHAIAVEGGQVHLTCSTTSPW